MLKYFFNRGRDIRDIIDVNKLNTGDIILFHCSNYWFSIVVEWLTWSDFSHVGMILRDPTYIHPDLKGLYILESGSENFPDAIEHRIQYGVQLVNFSKVVNSYSGCIYVKNLVIPKTFKDNMDVVLGKIWIQIKDKPYDDHIWDLIRVMFKIGWGDNNRYDNFFCSALITFIYEQCGFFRTAVSWDLITPKDFDDEGKIKALFIENVSLTSKYRIYKN